VSNKRFTDEMTPDIEFLGFQIWTGEKGFQVYSEVHQTLGNAVIHTLFLPIITFSVLKWVYVLSFHRNLARVIVSLMFLFYANFYAKMGPFPMATWTFLTLPIIILADSPDCRINTNFRCFLCFLIPLLVQEIIGHTFFEGINSRLTLSYVTNAVLYTPMFYTQGALRAVAFLMGYPWLHTNPGIWFLAGMVISTFGFYFTGLLLMIPRTKEPVKAS